MVLGIQVLVCRKEQEKFEDTRSRKFKKNRQHNDQMFEDTRYQKPLIEDEQTMK